MTAGTALRGKVVVVTGASGGVGRAVARRLGALGAEVALVARGEAGLAAAAAEVDASGGVAKVFPADMADYAQVKAVADAVERDLGPIDVWLNIAFATVFAPFSEITPEEYERTTAVTYLGYVWGTMAALERMRPRGRGTIVQCGSALAHRGIPLQSAYCGAKHAIKGFTESVRTELLAVRSGVRITMVHLPAVNTPQFSWGLSKLRLHPQPVPPIFQPEVAAEALVHAAAHPGRREYWVGGSTVATLLAQRLAPGLLDHYLARTGIRSQQSDRLPCPEANLWAPADDERDHGAHGPFDHRSHAHSPQAWLSRHRGPVLITTAVAAAVAGTALALIRPPRRRHR